MFTANNRPNMRSLCTRTHHPRPHRSSSRCQIFFSRPRKSDTSNTTPCTCIDNEQTSMKAHSPRTSPTNTRRYVVGALGPISLDHTDFHWNVKSSSVDLRKRQKQYYNAVHIYRQTTNINKITLTKHVSNNHPTIRNPCTRTRRLRPQEISSRCQIFFNRSRERDRSDTTNAIYVYFQNR